MHAVAVMIPEDLHLDVARIDHAALQEDLGAPECLGGLRDDALEVLAQGLGVVAAADPAPAAARGRLEHHRIADLLGTAQRGIQVFEIAGAAGRDRHTGLLHRQPRLGLVAHAGDHLGGRTDEGQPTPDAGARQLGVLGQKAVARMDRIATRSPRRD
jgi:hypothetical protein